MQESFLTAFNKLSDLKDKSVFGSWLKRIVVNNSIAEYNKKVKEYTVDLDTVLYKVEDDNGISEHQCCICCIDLSLITSCIRCNKFTFQRFVFTIKSRTYDKNTEKIKKLFYKA